MVEKHSEEPETKTNHMMNLLLDWCKRIKLHISAEKTTSVLIKWNLQRDPPNYLGVTIDDKKNFHDFVCAREWQPSCTKYRARHSDTKIAVCCTHEHHLNTHSGPWSKYLSARAVVTSKAKGASRLNTKDTTARSRAIQVRGYVLVKEGEALKTIRNTPIVSYNKHSGF